MPFNVGIGRRMTVRMISRTHGPLRPQVVDSVEFSPKLAGKEIFDYDDLLAQVAYSVYEGASGKIQLSQVDVRDPEAVLMDSDPTGGSGIIIDPSRLTKSFCVVIEEKNAAGAIFRSRLALYCVPTGTGLTTSPTDPSKLSIDFQCIATPWLNGLGIWYHRARTSTSPVAPPAPPTVTNSGTGGNLSDGAYYLALDFEDANGNRTQPSRERALIVGNGTATSSLSVTIPTIPAGATYVNLYMADESRKVRWVGRYTSGPATVTAVPQFSAKRPVEDRNETGAYVLPLDKVFGSGSLSANQVTLDKAAYVLPNSGVAYLGVLKNGEPQTKGFAFSDDGTAFGVSGTPAAGDVWETFTPFVP